jgi:hypothetical protein
LVQSGVDMFFLSIKLDFQHSSQIVSYSDTEDCCFYVGFNDELQLPRRDEGEYNDYPPPPDLPRSYGQRDMGSSRDPQRVDEGLSRYRDPGTSEEELWPRMSRRSAAPTNDVNVANEWLEPEVSREWDDGFRTSRGRGSVEDRPPARKEYRRGPDS